MACTLDSKMLATPSPQHQLSMTHSFRIPSFTPSPEVDRVHFNSDAVLGSMDFSEGGTMRYANWQIAPEGITAMPFIDDEFADMALPQLGVGQGGSTQLLRELSTDSEPNTARTTRSAARAPKNTGRHILKLDELGRGAGGVVYRVWTSALRPAVIL